MKNTPYTYLIGWSHLDMWYYGVRYSKDCHPSDLWRKYKTSSKEVKRFYQDHGPPDIVKVRRIFDDVSKARKWESKVLWKIGPKNKFRLLNKSPFGIIVNTPKSCRWVKKNSVSRFVLTQDLPIYIENGWTLGRHFSEEHKRKNSESTKLYQAKHGSPTQGKTHSEETKMKISTANKGRVSHYWKDSPSYELRCQSMRKPKRSRTQP